MKIAQVVSTYPPYRGGMGGIAWEYTQRLRSRGHHVHVFTPRHTPVDGDPNYVHRIPSPLHIGNTGVLPSLFYRLKGFDLVHLHYPFFGGAEPLIVGKALRPRQPLVVSYHMDVVGRGWKRLAFDIHRRMLFPWLMGRADRILTSSMAYARTSDLRSLSGISEKMEQLPFGVDLERYHPGSEPSLRERLGICLDVPVFLFVGGLDRAHYFKGVSIFLEALSAIGDREWHAVVVGDGDLRKAFALQASALGLEKRVLFVGSISEEEKPSYFRLADVHVFPSIDRSEAFGLVALEAAGSGIPTVASRLAGVDEAVEEGKTGLLVEPGNV